MTTVLLVEDNQHIREAAAEFLRLDGYIVRELESGDGVIDAVRAGGIDAVILDVMLPKASGFALAREIRRFSGLPIVFLTAKDSESDRIIGFELGADDYVVKPFSPKELVLRVRAVLRRVQGEVIQKPDQPAFMLEGYRLEIDEAAHVVYLDARTVDLTSTEWEILLHLTSYPGQVFSREVLLQSCLGYSPDGITRTVDTHIGNLRQKLAGAEWIATVRGYGYRFAGERV